MARAGEEDLEQLRAAMRGEDRLAQYEVKEAPKIIQEMTEEEYQRVVADRRDDFIVEDGQMGHQGYQDTGKEIWEDAEAAKEHRRAALQAQQASAAGKAADVAATTPPAATAVPARGTLHQMFQSGARAGATGSSEAAAAPIGDAHMQRDLDDMLNDMVGELETGDAVETAPADAPASSENAAGDALRAKNTKRKTDGASGRPAKKKAQAKASSTPASAPECSLQAAPEQEAAEDSSTQAMNPVNIGSEAIGGSEAAFSEAPLPEAMDTAAAADATVAVKQDPEVKKEPVVKQEPSSPPRKVKLEPVEPIAVKHEVKQELADPAEAVAAAQLRSWLTGGACDGVKVDLEEKAYEAAEAAEEAAAGGGQGRPRMQLENDGGMWFYFVDAYEDDRASPPRLYLFGKVRSTATVKGKVQHESCCLVVENIERSIHLLLNVEDLDNDTEAQETARRAEAEFDMNCRRQCPGVRKLRAKLKYRNYAFERSTKYDHGNLPFLKVVLDAAGQMPAIGMCGETFSQVFGAQTSMLESVLLRQRIMGPGWLRLKPKSWREDNARVSFCQAELRITPNSIMAAKTDEDRRQLAAMGMPASSPPVRMLSISMQTIQKSEQQPHEPLVISCTYHPNMNPDAAENDQDLREGMQQWAAVRRIDTRPLPRGTEELLKQSGVEYFTSEVALLNALLARVSDCDPDVIAGHNAYGFDLDVLSSRMHQLKIQGWQKMGRLRRPKDRVPHVEGSRGAGFWVGKSLTAGRLVCDVMLQAKDLLPKVQTYDLPSLSREQLDVKNLSVVEPEDLPRYFDKPKQVLELAELTFHSALCVARLAHNLQILPLTKQLTNLAGNLWNMSLQNKRAERNEMLLCHEFFKRKFVVPDKEGFASRKRKFAAEDPEGEENVPAASGRRGKAAYSGGLVLDPKVGLYDEFVIMLDFNSLYPSIIQEHNICFTTVERPNEVQLQNIQDEAQLLAATKAPDGVLDEGVLPQVIRRLVESRKNVRATLAGERDPKIQKMLDIRQKALKLTANSMYGCLGFQGSRFYCKPMAALVTARGRDALQTTITVVQQELQLDVVYGDTDSVFVNTKTHEYDQAMLAGNQIKKSVNKRYKRLEIEIDGVFHRLMLLKKKKYAAVKVVNWAKKEFERELKGLDIVRRDWCELAKSTGEAILMRVLQDGKEESVLQWAHNFLEETGKEMDDRKVPLQRYVITKGLTKDPKDYPDAKNQAHVQVAMRLIARGKHVGAGQEVEFVVCEQSAELTTKLSLAERARHPQELQLDPSLKVDVAWYKKQQVHPLVSRLLAPVEGTDAARVAECLGMDGSRFARAAAAAVDGGDGEAYARMAGNDVNALFDRKLRWKEYQSLLLGVRCRMCEQVTPWKDLLQPEVWDTNGVAAMFRCKHCPEKVHPKRAHNQFVLQVRGLLREHSEGWVQCQGGEAIEKTRRLTCGQNLTSSRAVHQELEYMEHLCEAESNYTGTAHRGEREAVAGMKRTVRWLLETNGFNWVDCGKVFGSIFTVK